MIRLKSFRCKKEFRAGNFQIKDCNLVNEIFNHVKIDTTPTAFLAEGSDI